MPVVGRAIFI